MGVALARGGGAPGLGRLQVVRAEAGRILEGADATRKRQAAAATLGQHQRAANRAPGQEPEAATRAAGHYDTSR